MTEKNFIPKSYTHKPENGNLIWESPSNIALIKYWGKKDNQIPANPSISFTLDKSKTHTKLSYSKKRKQKDYDFEVFLNGEKQTDFHPKIQKFFERIEAYVPFVKDYHFNIDTKNTFPHSSGIASSASGMSALALCLMSMEKLMNPEMTEAYFNRKASFLARLGSGSASRSIQGNMMVWGENETIEGSSDLFAIPYPYGIHDNFREFQDTILLVDKGEKQVSSSVGHNLMYSHPFAEHRFQQANDHFKVLKPILESGDLKAFISVVETEALTLHAMMMTSMPYFILMKPNTLEIINRIWKFRKESGLHPCFTLDAGANVHLLYPKKESEKLMEFIKNELVAFCQNGEYICDQIGNGPNQIQ